MTSCLSRNREVSQEGMAWPWGDQHPLFTEARGVANISFRSTSVQGIAKYEFEFYTIKKGRKFKKSFKGLY